MVRRPPPSDHQPAGSALPARRAACKFWTSAAGPGRCWTSWPRSAPSSARTSRPKLCSSASRAASGRTWPARMSAACPSPTPRSTSSRRWTLSSTLTTTKPPSCEIFRVLKPGGRLFVTVPAFPSLWSEHDEALHHYRRYTVPRLKDLFQRVGLSVDKISYTVTTLFPPIWAYRQISNLLPKRRAETAKRRPTWSTSPQPVNAALLALSQWETRLVRSPQPAIRRHRRLRRPEAREGAQAASERCCHEPPADAAPGRSGRGDGPGAAGLRRRHRAVSDRDGPSGLVRPAPAGSLRGYTICQVSDLHMRQMGRRERLLERLAARPAARRPGCRHRRYDPYRRRDRAVPPARPGRSRRATARMPSSATPSTKTASALMPSRGHWPSTASRPC